MSKLTRTEKGEVLITLPDGSEKLASGIEAMAWCVNRSLAISQYKSVNNPSRLLLMGINPKTIKRKGGRPPKYILQRSGIDGGQDIPVHKPEQIVQLVLKQKWQGGRLFSNTNGSDCNECFYRVADKFGCDVSQIIERYYKVKKSDRDEIEIWLIRLLYENNAIHKTKIKKAKRALNLPE